MITYDEVKTAIIDALLGRPVGQKVLVADHQAAEQKLLDFIQQYVSTINALPRQVHAYLVANEETTLYWNVPFANNNYALVFNAYSEEGTPCELYIIEKNADFVNVKALQNCSLNAIAIPY